jgi:hypothetical protein
MIEKIIVYFKNIINSRITGFTDCVYVKYKKTGKIKQIFYLFLLYRGRDKLGTIEFLLIYVDLDLQSAHAFKHLKSRVLSSLHVK